MSGRTSGGWEAVREVPPLWKALTLIALAVTSVGGGALGARTQAESFVSDKITEHNTAPKTEDPDKGPHPEFARAINEIKAGAAWQRSAMEALLRNQADDTCWKARVQAVDFEPDWRRRKDAADHAEQVCERDLAEQREKLVKNGTPPHLVDAFLDLSSAVKRALADEPKWRGIRGAR